MDNESNLEYLKFIYDNLKLNEKGCWIWMGRFNSSNKYGLISYNNKSIYVNKLFYKLQYKQWQPLDTVIQMRCNKRICVNPDHMYLISKIPVELIKATNESPDDPLLNLMTSFR